MERLKERKTRRRLSLTMDAETLARLHILRRRYGFATTCKMCRAMLVLVLNTLDRQPAERGDPERDIADMFDTYKDWEPQPDGDVPRRQWKRSVNDE